MGTGFRIFVVNDDDSLRRLSLARFERLRRRDREERLPEYAGKRVRYALVVMEVENRKPVGINLIQYGYLPFDSEGRFDHGEKAKEVKLAFDMLPPVCSGENSRQVIDAQHRFAKKRYDEQFKWTPSLEIEAAIVNAIFRKDYR